MYAARPNGADSATINPAALSSPVSTNTSLRGRKRGRSPASCDATELGDDGDSRYLRKRGKAIKYQHFGHAEVSGQISVSTMPQLPPPHTPQSQDANLPPQTTYAPVPAPAPAPPKTTPTKSTLKALPTVRDHTTDQLNETGDEYIPREIDEFGEKKVMQNGQLLGSRVYRCRTFLVPNRGDKLFMLATECARVLGYRDSYLLFNKNRSLYKIIASQAEKDDLVQQEILPFSYRSRQIAIVTARSMFRQFGSRVIENGRRVRDDYWEQKARKQGFTEADAAGEKRPGAAKAREAAEAQNNVLLASHTHPHTEIVYNSNPNAYPGPPQPPLIQAGMIGPPSGSATRMPGLTGVSDLNDPRPRDYSGIVKGGPRQEITGPPYQDQTRPTAMSEIQSHAAHTADFNRSFNQQRDMRHDYLQGIWRRPHEQPPSNLTQPAGSGDSIVPTSRPANSPHTAASGISQPPVVSSQSPQMMMTAPPYSQSIHAQAGQTPIRAGSTSSMGQTPTYGYQSGQAMWPSTPHQPGYGYTTQAQSSHPPQSSASHLRQPSTGSIQPGMQFPGMGSMQYGGGGSMYPAEQTPRQYLPQNPSSNPQVSQSWSGQHSPPQPQQQQQWWTSPQQPQ